MFDHSNLISTLTILCYLSDGWVDFSKKEVLWKENDMKKRILAEISRISEAYQMGSLIKLYETSFYFYVKFLLGTIGGLFSFMLVLALLVTRFNFSRTSLLDDLVLASCMLVAGLIYAPFLLLPRFSARNTRVYVYTNGLAYKNAKEIIVIYWQQIEQVTTKTNFCEILLKDGTVITFHEDIQGVQSLGRTIRRRVAKRSQQQP